MSYYLGIDVGGTHLRAAVATEDIDIVGRSVTRTPQRSGGQAVVDEVVQTVERACEHSGLDPAEIAAAGIGAAGPIDRDAGTLVGPPNLPGGGDRVHLVRPLRELLRTDAVTLRNDAVCGVTAERHFSDSATDDMVYLTMSTGIGAGVVVDGNVLSGHSGSVAEVGHTTVDPAGTMTCGCGCDGHWEAYCGGANIPDYAAHLQREASVETELPVASADFTAKEVFETTGQDELADLVVGRIGRWNTVGFANTIQAFDPTYVAVGGAVALNNPDAVLGPVRESVPDRVMVDVPEIAVSELGDDVVLKGAILTAQHQFERAR